MTTLRLSHANSAWLYRHLLIVRYTCSAYDAVQIIAYMRCRLLLHAQVYCTNYLNSAQDIFKLAAQWLLPAALRCTQHACHRNTYDAGTAPIGQLDEVRCTSDGISSLLKQICQCHEPNLRYTSVATRYTANLRSQCYVTAFTVYFQPCEGR